MLGAIAGDIIGSVHEGSGNQTKDFPLFIKECRFTDDTVLTVAVAERLLRGGDYIDLYHDYFSRLIRWRDMAASSSAGQAIVDATHTTAGVMDRPCESVLLGQPARLSMRYWHKHVRVLR